MVDGCCKSCCKSLRDDNYIQIKEESTNARVSRICDKCKTTLGPNVIGECPICKLEKDTTNNDMSRGNKFKSKKKVQKKSAQKKSIQKKSKKSVQKKSIQKKSKKKVQKKM